MVGDGQAGPGHGGGGLHRQPPGRTLGPRRAQVRALVRYNGRDDRGHLDRLPDEVRAAIEVHRGDLKDPEAVRKAVAGRAWVFHLGALIAIPYSYENPLDVVQTNVVGTAHVLDACRDNPALERVVLTSTSEVYGTAQFVPITEAHPLRGQSPYAASKIGADALGESYHRSFGLPVGDPPAVQHLRPPPVGPGDHPDDHQPGAVAAGGEARQPRPPTRPDLRQGHRRAASSPSPSAPPPIGRAVNIGRGDDLTIGELVTRIGERIGRPIGSRPTPTASAPPPARSAASWPATPWPES